VELKEKIEENIQKNNGEALDIENRMLSSINSLIEESGLSISEIKETKKMPDFASILSMLEFDRLSYIVLQRIGSHHVHGTWPSLMFHYLEKNDNGTYSPRDHDCEPHVNQFIYLPLLVIEALKDFTTYIMSEENEGKVLHEFLDSIKEKILDIDQYIIDEDMKD